MSVFPKIDKHITGMIVKMMIPATLIACSGVSKKWRIYFAGWMEQLLDKVLPEYLGTNNNPYRIKLYRDLCMVSHNVQDVYGGTWRHHYNCIVYLECFSLHMITKNSRLDYPHSRYVDDVYRLRWGYNMRNKNFATEYQQMEWTLNKLCTSEKKHFQKLRLEHKMRKWCRQYVYFYRERVQIDKDVGLVAGYTRNIQSNLEQIEKLHSMNAKLEANLEREKKKRKII